MDTSYWLQKWKDNNIAFHKSEAHPLLVKHFKALSISPGSRVFLPLCGKTLDIGWLLSEGYRVAGAELSELAIEQLFTELGTTPKISNAGDVKHYGAENIDIFVGNLFELSSTVLGPIDAIYDRAALVALPEATRNRYTAHLKSLTNKAPQLLICFEYDQALMAGPPFSISDEEVAQHYSDSYKPSLIEQVEMPGGLKGTCAAKENVWRLQKRPPQ
ncbi:MAG: thiopurine S-methyltransferase [Phormidesmis sp.]